MPKRRSLTPASPDIDEGALAERMVSRDREQAVDQHELVRRLAGGMIRAGGLTAGVGAAVAGIFDAGVTSGALSLIGSACAASEMLVLGEAKARLEKAGKKVDWLSAGFGLAGECARDGARAGSLMREQWVRLLMACMDPSTGKVIRQADLELLRSLNPPDALLMLAIGRYKHQMLKEWRNSRACTLASQNGIAKNAPERFPLELVLTWSKTIFGKDATISADELAYALFKRHVDVADQEGVPLFKGRNEIDNWTRFLQPSSELEPDDRFARMSARMIEISLTPRAERLVSLLVEPANGF